MDQEFVGHTPVLPQQVARLISVSSGETVVDTTVGLGGHSSLFATALGNDGRLIALDVDPANLAEAERRLAGQPCRIQLIQSNFACLRDVLADLGVDRVDVVFADLGVSSTQLDESDRGFSFLRDGPLDMRMDPSLETSAADLVNRMKEKELGDLIYRNSQERASRRIARLICLRRKEGRITTTDRLARIVAEALGVSPESRRHKIHPATRTFQALRIAVNDEIGALGKLLDTVPDLLSLGGRFGVISFHSIEDRPVKLAFRKGASEGKYEILTKKPVAAEEDERLANPRSRSAKLRVVRRLPDAR